MGDILINATAFIDTLLPDAAAMWAIAHSMYLIAAILALSLGLLLIRRKRERGGDAPLEGALYTANWILLVLLSGLELFYVAALGGNATWFCKPDQVGWLWTVINFFIFGFVVLNQLLCYLNTLRDMQYNSYAAFDWRLGLYAWPIALIALILAALFFEPGMIIAVALFVIAQLLQIGIVLKQVVPHGGWTRAFLWIGVYFIGALATVAILIHFLVLLAVVLLALLALSIFGGDSRKSNATGQKDSITRCRACGVAMSGRLHFCSRLGYWADANGFRDPYANQG